MERRLFFASASGVAALNKPRDNLGQEATQANYHANPKTTIAPNSELRYSFRMNFSTFPFTQFLHSAHLSALSLLARLPR
jgi:hypothetical protein